METKETRAETYSTSQVFRAALSSGDSVVIQCSLLPKLQLEHNRPQRKHWMVSSVCSNHHVYLNNADESSAPFKILYTRQIDIIEFLFIAVWRALYYLRARIDKSAPVLINKYMGLIDKLMKFLVPEKTNSK